MRVARSVRRVVGARDRPAGDAPAARDGAADDGRGRARAVLRAGRGAAHGRLARALADGQWGSSAAEALESLHAEDTELAHALSGLARALEAFARRPGPKPNLEAMCLELVLAGDRLHGALADPVKALHPASRERRSDSLVAQRDRERAARRRARRARDPRARAVDARRLVRVARPRRVGAARGRGARRDPSHAAAAAAAEEEGAEAHRRATSS